MKLVAWVMVAAIAGCKSEKAPAPPPTETKMPVPDQPAPVATRDEEPPPAGGAVTAFKLDGKAAETAPKPSDHDEDVGAFNITNKHLALFIHGDLPGSPRRGMVDIGLDAWKPEPGTYTGRLRFTHYLDASGGKQLNWHVKASDPATVTFTKVEPQTDGKRWRVAGTFSAPKPLELDLGLKSDRATITITDGTFENLIVQQLGRAP